MKTDRANKAPPPNRRPPFPLGGHAKFGYSFCAPPASPAAVGEPSEAQCRRLPLERDFTPSYPPWEEEDKARFTGRSEQDLGEERKARAEDVPAVQLSLHWSLTGGCFALLIVFVQRTL